MNEEKIINKIKKDFYDYHYIERPTVLMCLTYLRARAKETPYARTLKYIPIKHKKFCKLQMKLEGIDINE